jgi:hypothetical protein
MLYLDWNINVMRISMLRSTQLNLQTERLKKKLCYQVLLKHRLSLRDAGVTFDNAQETYTARYTHETVALAFSITEEAIEDNLYDRLASRYTKALARSMANTKQVKAVAPLINGLPTNDAFDSGDGVSLFNTAHPTIAGTVKNTLTTQADLNETSLEQCLIDISAMTDERGLKIAARGVKMIVPSELQFTAERLMKSQGRVGTADNDINAIVSMGMVPQGYRVNNFLTDHRCVLHYY